MATTALKSTPVHDTLRKVVVLFRLIALLWMGALVTATLLSDSGASVGWVLAAGSVAIVGALGTLLMSRLRRLDVWWWVLIDGAATAFIVMAPGLAGARDLFYGGMGLSWLVVVVWAYPSAVHWALAIVSLVGAQLAGSALGVRRISATGFVGDIAVWTVSGIVYGWAFWIVRSTDLRRQEAESHLAEEIRQRSVVEARAAIAADIHDSVLQALSFVQAHGTDKDVVDIAANQDKELRRYLARISAEHLDGLEVMLREAAWDVEDRYGVRVEVVCVRDCKRDDAIDDLVAAAREALTNAARHSHDSTISVYAEVHPEAVSVFVKDDGVGFELSNAVGVHRGIERSIVGRMRRRNGTARIATAPGHGTEVELTLPRVNP